MSYTERIEWLVPCIYETLISNLDQDVSKRNGFIFSLSSPEGNCQNNTSFFIPHNSLSKMS